MKKRGVKKIITSVTEHSTSLGSLQILGERIDWFRSRIRPDEIGYVVDCATADVEQVSALYQSFFPRLDSFEKIYESVHESFLSDVTRYADAIIRGSNKMNWAHYDKNNITSSVNYYRDFQGNVIKKHVGVLMLENGLPRYTYGIIQNLYDDVAINQMTYRLNGGIAAAQKLLDFKYKNDANITARESQILSLLKYGQTSQQIGVHLNISKETVNTHRRNILKKLGAPNTIEAVRKAELQLII